MAEPKKIIKRRLTQKEAMDFSREMTLTPNITGYRPAELMKLSDIWVVERSSETIGMLAYIETGRFIDLKVLLVKQAYRGKGYGKELVRHALSDLANSEKPVYAVTRNPLVAKLLTAAGFSKRRFLNLPLACQIHQAKMAFSLYRIRETLRKRRRFPGQPKFAYYIRRKDTG